MPPCSEIVESRVAKGRNIIGVDMRSSNLVAAFGPGVHIGGRRAATHGRHVTREGCVRWPAPPGCACGRCQQKAQTL